MLSSPPQVSTVIDVDPKELVNNYGITEKELARLLGVSYPLVRSWFCGDRQPQLYHCRAAGLLKYNLDNKIFRVKKGVLSTV